VLIAKEENCKDCGIKRYGLTKVFMWLEGLRKDTKNLSYGDHCPDHVEIRRLLIQVAARSWAGCCGEDEKALAAAGSPPRYRATSRGKEGAEKEKTEDLSSTDPYNIKMVKGGGRSVDNLSPHLPLILDRLLFLKPCRNMNVMFLSFERPEL
jgi:hypothetical protein